MPNRDLSFLCIMPVDPTEAVLASGLVARLVREAPGARLTVVGGVRSAPLFRDTPGLERLITAEPTNDWREWLELWRRLNDRRWTLVLDTRGTPIQRYLKARKRAIRREAGAPAHRVLEAAHLLRLEDDPPAPQLFTSVETEAQAEALTPPGGPILALAPTAEWVGAVWPLERYGLMLARLFGREGPLAGARLMMLGAAGDWKTVEPLRRAVGSDRFIDLTGEDLLTCYACLRRARLFVGNATVFLHLAAAAGAPTLGLFGPTDEKLYAPWGDAARFVRGARSFEAIRANDPKLNQPVCHMLHISVDAVVAAAQALLSETAEFERPDD
jgi:ADP-heptose:LPS heptosyltransferase